MTTALIVLGGLSVLATGFILAGIIAAKRPLPEYHGTEGISSFFPSPSEERKSSSKFARAT